MGWATSPCWRSTRTAPGSSGPAPRTVFTAMTGRASRCSERAMACPPATSLKWWMGGRVASGWAPSPVLPCRRATVSSPSARIPGSPPIRSRIWRWMRAGWWWRCPRGLSKRRPPGRSPSRRFRAGPAGRRQRWERGRATPGSGRPHLMAASPRCSRSRRACGRPGKAREVSARSAWTP